MPRPSDGGPKKKGADVNSVGNFDIKEATPLELERERGKERVRVRLTTIDAHPRSA